MNGTQGEMGADGPPGPQGMDLDNNCAVYTRWGHFICGPGETRIYEGFTAATKHSDAGGGSNFLCLPFSFREFDENQDPTAIAQSTIVSIIINALPGEPYQFSNGQNFACALCSTTHAHQLMIPGTSVCPNEPGWSTIYTGYLMSSRDTPSETLINDADAHFRTKYICVSEVIGYDGTSTFPEAPVYHVYLDCDTGASLSCNSESNEQLTCAVCGYTPPV